jgi:organic anion transporter 3A
MTGLYSEAQDDSSADLPQDTSESDSLPNIEDDDARVHVTVSTTLANPSVTTTCITSSNTADTVIKCHSRQPSNSAGLMEKNNDDSSDEYSRDCGILSCRPAKMQKLARIKVSVQRENHCQNEKKQF